MDPQPDPPPLRLLTPKQVAARLSVSVRTLRRMMDDPESGLPEPSWLAGSPRWFPEDVERYLLDLYRGKAGKRRRKTGKDPRRPGPDAPKEGK